MLTHAIAAARTAARTATTAEKTFAPYHALAPVLARASDVLHGFCAPRAGESVTAEEYAVAYRLREAIGRLGQRRRRQEERAAAWSSAWSRTWRIIGDLAALREGDLAYVTGSAGFGWREEWWYTDRAGRAWLVVCVERPRSPERRPDQDAKLAALLWERGFVRPERRMFAASERLHVAEAA